MKLHLPVRLFLAVLAATVVPSYADTTLISEGINKDDVTKSERFYDTGKGHYFSWNMSYFWEDLVSLRKKNGSFAFLGDLYDRIPSNAKTLNYDSLTDDSDTCWAQVSMNLVEYWHSYYGVFCEDSRKLTYGLCYDKKYLDKTGGTLSLKQNLVFLDTFTNVGDSFESYLDWMMLGYENPWYSKIEQSGNGGFWTDYFYGNSHNWGCDLLESVDVSSGSIKTLSSGLLRLLGFSRQDGSYVQTTKGQLVYVSMSGISSGGHAITCHGVELDARGQVMALYVTNSDDLEYKLFKLYIKERNGAIALYENEDCTELWEYAGTGWVINRISSIRTPEALKAKLELYESADNALVWTGNTACNGEWDLSAGYTSAYLPDETTGWHIKVVDDFYAAFYDAERIISFDDSAESGVVTVTNSGSTHRMELNNKELEYSFTGTGSNELTVDTLVAAGGGKASFRKLQLTTEEAFINEHTVSIGSGATWRGQAQIEAKGRVELAGGILALTQLTLNEGSLSLTADSTIKSGNITVSGAASLVFSPATSGTAPLLTIGSAVSFSGSALDIAMGGDNLTLDSTYALIHFEKKDFEPGDLFTTEQGELSFADNILYLFYNPVPKLSWSTTSGTWSATQWGNSSTATDDLRAEFSGSDTQTVSISGTVSPHSIKVNNSGDITFTGSGNISGSAALTKNGSGSLTISTANSFTGGSTIKDGVVNFGTAQALGTGSITASDCTLNFNNANISNELYIAGNTVITNGQSYSGALVLENGELTGGSLRLSKDATVKSGGISNDLTGSAGMTKSGSGTVTLSGNNSFSGTTHIAEGTLVAGNAQALGSGKVSLTGGTLDMNNKALKNDVRASGVDVYITNGGNYSGALTLTGGKLTVEGGNMSCGSLTLGGGVILFDGRADGTTPQMSVDGVLSITAATEIGYTGAYSVGTHVLFSFDSLSGNIENLTLATPSGKMLEYTLYREGNMLLADIMACGSELEWRGKKGTWTIGGGNWNNGRLFGDGDSVTFSQAATVTIAGEVSPSLITVNSDKSVTFKTSYKKKTATYSGAIIGNADLYKSGKGKLTMNDGNTDWTGNIYLSEGTLKAKGGASFGSGTLYLSGGVLDLSSKAVANDIVLSDDACIKGGKKFAGSLDVSAALLTGTSVNIEEGQTATLHGGTHSASLYGNGTVIVDGRVSWRTGSITTAAMEITGDSARFTAQTKGLVMNSKKSSIVLSDGGTLISQGKISAYALTMSGEDSLLDVTNQKPVSVSLKGDVSFTDAHKVKVYGAFSANQLTAVDSILTFAPDRSAIKPKAQSVSLKGKGVLNTISGSEVDIAGKMSVTADLQLTDSDVALHDVAGATKPKAQGLTVKGELAVEDDSALVMTGTLSAGALSATDSTIAIAAEDGLAAQNLKLTRKQVVKGVAQENLLTNSSVYVNGGMSVAGNLELNNSAIYLRDYSGKNKAKGLTVKGDLTLDSTSSIVLSGALSAKNLTLGTGSSLTLTASKPGTVKVGGALTLEGAVSLDLGFSVSEKDFKKQKVFKIFSFKTMGGNLTEDSDLNELFGISSDLASLSFASKGKAITLVVVDFEGWNEYVADVQAEAQQITPESEPVADVAEEETAEELLTAPQPAAAEAVDSLLAKAADTLVQSTWGTVGASRAFGETIASRGRHATLLDDGKGAAWLSVMGGSSRISSADGHNGADFTLSGAAFGVEGRVGEKSTLGVAIGNSWGKVSTFSAFPVDQDSMHVGIYGNHTLTKSLTLSWMATHTRTESDATLLGAPYSWSQDALQLDARLTWGKSISEKTAVSAFAGLQYLATDSGECAGLKTGSLQNLRAEFGVGASHKLGENTMVFGELSFIGDMVRNNPTAAIGDYRTHGTNPGRVGLNLSVGAQHQLSEDWSLNASYSLELMENSTSHSLNVGASYSF